VPILPTPIQHSPGIAIQRLVKGIQIGKETVKISLYGNEVILYFKDPKNPTPKLLDTINSFSNVARYKINLQKSVAFPYTNNE
jgi:hypothetical protein